MMFGKCRVCEEKEKRIASLEREIAFLRTAAFRPVDNSKTTDSELEADGVISGHDQVIEIPATPETHKIVYTKEEEAVLAERDEILSGAY